MVLLDFHGFSLDTEVGLFNDLTADQPILHPNPPPHSLNHDSYQHLKLDPATNHQTLFHSIQQVEPHAHLFTSLDGSLLSASARLGHGGLSAADAPLDHQQQPSQAQVDWSEPVTHTLEAAYGNYINDERYKPIDQLSTGLPTPDFGWSQLDSLSDNSSGEWSPNSLHSPSVDDSQHPLSHASSSSQLFCSPAAFEGVGEAGVFSGEGTVASSINPLMLSPGVQPADAPLSLEALQALNVQLGLSSYDPPSASASCFPTPESRRASLAPTPIQLAPLPPLPPLPDIPRLNHTRTHSGPAPSSRLLELTATALARRAQQGIFPPSASSSRSGSHSRDHSQHGRTPSEEDDDDDDESESDTGKAAPSSRARGVRSAARQPTAAAPRSRPPPAGVAGFVASCSECSTQVATLHFRGKADALAVAVRGSYVCVGCQPLSAEPTSGHHRRQSSNADEDGVACEGYGATLSAALDRLQGNEDNSHSSRGVLARERVPSSALGLSGVNKSVVVGGGSDLLCCDVCKYAVARGSLVPVNAAEQVSFGVEAVCQICRDKYRRCSDCGGGGGPRLGVGKWRALELFPGGRKTCQLSHLRLGSLDDMSYDIHLVRDLPPKNLETLLTACADIHYTSVVTTLATPDALESECPPARSFDEVHRLAVDGWSLYEQLIKEDIEPTEGKRRYVGLRWSTPVPRKKAKNSKSKAAAAAPAPQKVEPPLPKGSILRPGKKLVGVVIGELDLANGSLFLPLTMPTGSVGEQYDGQTALYLALHERIKADLTELNATRTIRAQLPSLREAWTVAMVRKDARGLNYLEKRRGYAPLDHYAARQHGNNQIQRAPNPHQRLTAAAEAFLPPELLPGWAIFAREVSEFDEWAARTTGVAAAHAQAAAAMSAVAAQQVTSQKRKVSLVSDGSLVTPSVLKRVRKK